MIQYPFDRTPEYWTGWALAYYQWNTGLRFSEIEHVIPIQTIWMMYDPYHEMDIRQLVDKLNELYRKVKAETLLRLSKVLDCSMEDLIEKIDE